MSRLKAKQMKFGQPKMIRDRGADRTDIPTEPGRYYWSEWKAFVDVVRKGRSLFVTPPASTAVEVKITNNIAGSFSLMTLVYPISRYY